MSGLYPGCPDRETESRRIAKQRLKQLRAERKARGIKGPSIWDSLREVGFFIVAVIAFFAFVAFTMLLFAA